MTEIHRVLKFNQKPWVKEYIDFNTERRKIAQNSFERDFYKLMNNVCYGKSMENVRNHRHFEIAVGKSKVQKLIAKPQFTG